MFNCTLKKNFLKLKKELTLEKESPTKLITFVCLKKAFLPGGGPRYGSSCVYQHTPAVASGGVTLNWFVKASLGTIWYKNSIVFELPCLFLGRLFLLVA